MLCQQEVVRVGETRDRLQSVLEVVASAAAHDRYAGAATALVTDLATRLNCDRVSIGFVQGGQIKIEAVSHSAQFKERTNLLRAVAAAMDEAVDQNATILVPHPSGSAPLVRRASADLVTEHGSGAVCTVPMQVSGKPAGALTLERSAGRPFDAATVELCEAIAGLAGPMLDVHRRENRWFGARIAGWWREKIAHLFGPRHGGLKLSILLDALAAFLTVRRATSAFRHTVLEPQLQIAARAVQRLHPRGTGACRRPGEEGRAARAAGRPRAQAGAPEIPVAGGGVLEADALCLRGPQSRAGTDPDRAARPGESPGRTRRGAAAAHRARGPVRRRWSSPAT
jgi:hypothetical protein